MRKYFFVFQFALLIFAFATQSFGHGEDKPGPNGGFIRMPGVFHTEVVPDKKDQSFHLYLLDIEFKNPTVKDSSVDAHFEHKGKPNIKFSCEVMGGNHYHCKPSQKYSSKKGKLILSVKREGQTGTSVYEMPLKWQTPQVVPSDAHKGHDMHH